VSSNGNVNFTGSFVTPFNASIPTSQIATLVAPWWDDLVAVGDQNVFWDVTGTAPNRELVIEWRDVRHFDCRLSSTTTVKFQVVFFEGSSDLLFNYADTAFGGGCTVDDRGGSATVGAQASPSLGTQFSFNTQTLSDNTSLVWTTTDLTPTIDVNPSSRDFGDVPVGSWEDRTFTVQNVGSVAVGGNATADAPFQVVSGGSYSLSVGQSQRVTVRFSPTSTGPFGGSVTFSGTRGVTRSVTGAGISVSPMAPSGLTAAAVSTRQITLAWQDHSFNEKEFRIERKPGSRGAFGQIATVAANVTGFSDTGVRPETTYVYRVRACNGAGCSGHSNEVSARPHPPRPCSFRRCEGRAPGHDDERRHRGDGDSCGCGRDEDDD
jgi:hypothetical protein